MTSKEGSQIPFGELVRRELVMDLDTGRRTVRRKRSKKAPVEPKPTAPIKPWWDRSGFMAFTKAAAGWEKGQEGLIAEDFGQNMEFGASQMMDAETTDSLEKTFAIARRSSIKAMDIVGLMKAESLSLEQRLGRNANWVPAFVDSTIGVLAGVYKLSPDTTEALKRVAHQRKLPQFN